MLDGIGLAARLELDTAADLFGEASSLLHPTSAVRYPVSYEGRNYTGRSPGLVASEILTGFVHGLLGREISGSNALVVPLGAAATEAIEFLMDFDDLSPHRVIMGFPHPSGANAHRRRRYQENQASMADAVRTWSFGT